MQANLKPKNNQTSKAGKQTNKHADITKKTLTKRIIESFLQILYTEMSIISENNAMQKINIASKTCDDVTDFPLDQK